jgi:hypothetical protein
MKPEKAGDDAAEASLEPVEAVYLSVLGPVL